MQYVKTNLSDPELIQNAQELDRNLSERFSKETISLMDGWSTLLAVCHHGLEWAWWPPHAASAQMSLEQIVPAHCLCSKCGHDAQAVCPFVSREAQTIRRRGSHRPS